MEQVAIYRGRLQAQLDASRALPHTQRAHLHHRGELG